MVSTSLHPQGALDLVRETVLHIGPGGHLLSVLPCLGPGPRDFLPVILPSPGEYGAEHAAWHVYMRDGHEGIIAVRL